MKKALSLTLSLMLMLGLLAGCGGNDTPAEEPSEAPSTTEEAPEETPEETPSIDFTVAMVTDVGGINDESFNQSAWEGMERLAADFGADISFVESEKDADYIPNLDKLADASPDIIWGIGFLMYDAMKEAAENNPDQLFALIDESYPDGELPNVISVMFHAEQPSFLVGYVASYMTETDHVGFILGMESPVMDQFKYGYFAGVQYGAAEQGKEITVDFGLVESFADSAKGKAMAQKMYTDGADVIFHAAGQSGSGAIEAAKEMDMMAIGVDLDQNFLAPDNVITSALKNVGNAVYEVTERVMNGESLGGTTVNMGLAEGGVDIAPTSNKHLPAELLSAVEDLKAEIIAGNVVVPANEADYNAFVDAL